MIRITAQLEDNLAAAAGRHLPFAVSLALNRTATGARDLVRENLPKRFKLRNNWTKGGIQTRASTRANLVAQILAPGYMAIQETGGERNPDAGRTLTAPSTAMQSDRVIPKAKRPRAMLAGKAFIIGMRDGDAGVFIRTGRKGRKTIKLLYWLTDSQQYDERFEFEADVEKHAGERFGRNFASAMADALK